MPRITPQTELDKLLSLIAAQADGMGIEALASLVAQGQIQIVGE